ncbi:MAG: hypothetical protein LBF27_05870 [Sphingobacterium sp.]|jgi:hypothetical protein|nr:hypothetical protein [Sphingobacterium sp.]
MEDIIVKSGNLFDPQKFRITFKERDFEIVLLKKDLKKETTEFSVLLDGIVQHLIKMEGIWHFVLREDQDLANDIWRQITLRLFCVKICPKWKSYVLNLLIRLTIFPGA